MTLHTSNVTNSSSMSYLVSYDKKKENLTVLFLDFFVDFIEKKANNFLNQDYEVTKNIAEHYEECLKEEETYERKDKQYIKYLTDKIDVLKKEQKKGKTVIKIVVDHGDELVSAILEKGDKLKEIKLIEGD